MTVSVGVGIACRRKPIQRALYLNPAHFFMCSLIILRQKVYKVMCRTIF